MKYRVKIFSGAPTPIEQDINRWMDTCSVKVMKVHPPVEFGKMGSIAVLVEYTIEEGSDEGRPKTG